VPAAKFPLAEDAWASDIEDNPIAHNPAPLSAVFPSIALVDATNVLESKKNAPPHPVAVLPVADEPWPREMVDERTAHTPPPSLALLVSKVLSKTTRPPC